MALPLRTRTVPQCSACIRSYAFGGFNEPSIGAAGLGQQVRGKRKVAVVASTVPVRLLKNVKAFGRKGSIVPISMGRMRNEWFPRRIAEYMTGPETRELKLKSTPIERDFGYDAEEIAMATVAARQASAEQTYQQGMTRDMQASMQAPRRAPEVEKVTPERGMQLLEIFVPQRLDFFRQPIVEEIKEPEPEKPRRQRNMGTGAAAELYAARLQAEQAEAQVPKSRGPQAIYGSVSTHDVLNAVRAAMGNNDESARVMIAEEDIRFVDAGDAAAEETGKVVKHVGDFTVEIKVKGAEEGIRRLVKVNAQEA